MKQFDRFPLVPTLLVLSADLEKHHDDPQLHPNPDDTPVLCRMDLAKVESYRKVLDTDGEINADEVHVRLISGDHHNLEMSFEDFDMLYMRYVESIS